MVDDTGTNEPSASTNDDVPLPQKLLDRIWLLAISAIIFFTLSYIVWGHIDIFTIPTGG